MSGNRYGERAAFYEQRRRRRRRIILRRLLKLLSVILAISVVCYIAFTVFKREEEKVEQKKITRKLNLLQDIEIPDWVDVQLIDLGGTSRSGLLLSSVSDIVIHYVGNPGTTAAGNRSYFNMPDTEVSAHFIVGLEGEILQCVPINEKASASNHRNSDTIAIEVCHPDNSGKFSDVTYESVIRLTAWLCDALELTAEDVIRHYDITEKLCPKYYVDNEDAWNRFKEDVEERIEEIKGAE